MKILCKAIQTKYRKKKTGESYRSHFKIWDGNGGTYFADKKLGVTFEEGDKYEIEFEERAATDKKTGEKRPYNWIIGAKKIEPELKTDKLPADVVPSVNAETGKGEVVISKEGDESKGAASPLVPMKPFTELLPEKAPEEIINDAVRRAKALKDIVDKKEHKVIINKQQYLEFEDWQTMARFYGLLVRTGDALPVTIDKVRGAKARARVYTVSGVEIGSAEAYCLSDEPNWRGKPFFQLASMAQTRAGAKALRNILAWVVVLAGYRATPAEEMEGVK